MKLWRVVGWLFDEFFYNSFKNMIAVETLTFNPPTPNRIKILKDIGKDCEEIKVKVEHSKQEGLFHFSVVEVETEHYGLVNLWYDTKTFSIKKLEWKYPSVLSEVYEYFNNIENKLKTRNGENMKKILVEMLVSQHDEIIDDIREYNDDNLEIMKQSAEHNFNTLSNSSKNKWGVEVRLFTLVHNADTFEDMATDVQKMFTKVGYENYVIDYDDGYDVLYSVK